MSCALTETYAIVVFVIFFMLNQTFQISGLIVFLMKIQGLNVTACKAPLQEAIVSVDVLGHDLGSHLISSNGL